MVLLTQNRHGVGGSMMCRSVVIFLDLPDAACGFRITPPFATISASPEFSAKRRDKKLSSPGLHRTDCASNFDQL
jgi:hypothetical protein